MNTRKLSALLLAIALFAYNYLFWKEKQGINLPLFTIALTAILALLYKESFRRRKVIIALGGTLITGAMVVLFNTTISVFAHYICFIVLCGFVHHESIQTVYLSVVSMLANFFKSHPIFIRAEEAGKKARRNSVGRFIKLAILPSLVFLLFYMIYAIANPVFLHWSTEFWNSITDLISFSHIAFLLLGFWLLGVFLYKRQNKLLNSLESNMNDDLLRIKTKNRNYFSNMLSLKNENRIGIIMLASVNVLLLLVNIIDIDKIWFNFKMDSYTSLKQFVHTGTELLIFSIIIAIIMLLILFQGNQNFYSKNKALKYLAYTWIFQNIVLCISLCLRNSYYIGFHGLAYGRIGVYVFIGMAIFGLITLYLKISQVKSFFYLCRLNTWAAFMVLVLLSTFNWDRRIAEYNLDHWNGAEIDVDFYFRLSDNALPVLIERRADIIKQIRAHRSQHTGWGCEEEELNVVPELIDKRDHYLNEHGEYTWPSWNIADENTSEYLKCEGGI